MHIKYIACVSLLLLPGCYRVGIQQEVAEVQDQALNRVRARVRRHEQEIQPIMEIDDEVYGELSRNEAVSIALMNSRELQVQFEELGIAKSDLQQAGFFTNPQLNTAFRFPSIGKTPNIEIDASVKLSDFWIVPRTKQVAEDELEIVTLHVLRLILDIVAEAKIAYDACHLSQEQLSYAQSILNKAEELYKRICYRKEFGLSGDLDIYHAQAMYGMWQQEVIHLQADLKRAYIHLRRVLGVAISIEPVKLIDEPCYQRLGVPDLCQLESYALNERPEIMISRLRIAQARHILSLEKARVVNDVDIGVASKWDFEGDIGHGPLVNISLPFFDNNFAQISRAEYLIERAEKEYRVVHRDIQQELQREYYLFEALQHEIGVYEETILHATKSAIEYAEKFYNTMQLNMLHALNSYILLYEQRKALAHLKFNALQSFAHLERSLGKRLDDGQFVLCHVSA